MKFLAQLLSFLFDIRVKKVASAYSGELEVVWSQGRKLLNTSKVNYSFQSLHRVFKTSFKQAGLPKDIKNVLVLGLGGGSIPEMLRKVYRYPGPIDAVEIDPVVVELAETEFDIHRFDPITIYTMDASTYIKELTKSYGLICMDVFIHDQVPDELLSSTSIAMLINNLLPNGKLFINVMTHPSRSKSQLEKRITQAISNHGKVPHPRIQFLQPEENNLVIVITK